MEFVVVFTGHEFHEFHENDRCHLDVIGLKYNSPHSLAAVLDSTFNCTLLLFLPLLQRSTIVPFSYLKPNPVTNRNHRIGDRSEKLPSLDTVIWIRRVFD
ncbi:MAG: hypothetical protein DMG10_12570 [Acidobacteria bacterium]|nr:MAG: hypothetical protein DMG10_12570 [Acidobacteriota bacterium]